MNKYKILKSAALSSLLILMLQNAALADGLDIKTEHIGDKVKFTGTVSAGEIVTVEVLRDGYVRSELTDANRSDAVAFVSAATANENGEFEITAKFADNGTYTLYLTAPSQTDMTDRAFYFTKADDYRQIITELNAKLSENDETGFKNLIKTNRALLGFDENLSGEGDFDTAAGLYCNECIKNGMTADFDKNAATFTKCLAITALNKSQIVNVYEYVEDILTTDATMSKYAAKHIKNEEAEKYFTQKLSGKSIADITDLKSKCAEALILTAVKYPDGNMNIKAVFDDYKSVIGITSVSSSGSVYTALAGKSYDSMTALKSAYDTAVGAAGSSSGGGTGGGGSGSSVSTSSGIGSVEIGGSNTNEINALKIKFDDLDSVEWAYKDIAELYENGIISGYDEYSFKPDYSVTREQFVKMLVCTAGLENTSAEPVGFADVKSGDWFEKYVNIAYKNSLISGMDDNKFGTGYDISRQDMAVIIYNAIRQRGYEPQNAGLSFDDADICAEYAKEAVAELSAIGIITGVGDNKFDPAGTATRAQAAVIINRALKYLQ